jgi:hypothetical protein
VYLETGKLWKKYWFILGNDNTIYFYLDESLKVEKGNHDNIRQYDNIGQYNNIGQHDTIGHTII